MEGDNISTEDSPGGVAAICAAAICAAAISTYLCCSHLGMGLIKAGDDAVMQEVVFILRCMDCFG